MSPPSSRALPIGVLLAATGAFLGSLWLHRGAALYDTDSSYHLAIAGLYADEGLDAAPPLRASLLGREDFGDKELLFHLLLAPLVAVAEPEVAGRIALALMAAALAAAFAAAAVREVGAWGALVPFWVVFASTETAWRLVRLRPELLSLLLLLLAARAMVAGRARLLGLWSFLYTLSYTAFQAFLGLVGLAFLALGRERSGRRPWELPVAAGLGAGLGLLAHPHFPHNLEIWALQNVRFFLSRSHLAIGTEIRPNTTDVTLMVHLGWLLGLLVLWRAARPVGRPAGDVEPGEAGRSARVHGVFTLAFGVLYLLMSRFSLYFFPFATLALLSAIRARGRRVGARVALAGIRTAGTRTVPLAVAALVALGASAPEAVRQLGVYRHRTDPGPGDARRADREAFARALPSGARVAADWGPTGIYLLRAPHGRYLNALDPVFMAAPFPEAERLLAEILAGREPDVPAAAVGGLGSEFLAWPWHEAEALRERLEGDPRVEVLHRGLDHLVRFRPAAGFVLDWRVAPPLDLDRPGARPPVDGGAIDGWPALPLPPDPVRRVAAYVDAERLAPERRCVGFARNFAATGTPREAELAPWGPTAAWLDDRPLVALDGDLQARPGRGVRLRLDAGAGGLLVVVTCEGRAPDRKGFFWRELAPAPVTAG